MVVVGSNPLTDILVVCASLVESDKMRTAANNFFIVSFFIPDSNVVEK
jgi:hypothetical protein